MRKTLLGLGVATAGAAATYLGLVTGACPVDLGIGRRTRALGPQTIQVRAPQELVFDIVSAPYLKRQSRAIAEKIEILERGSDLVLAAHHTPIRGQLSATTVETVKFSRPDRIDFRLVRGPVPHVLEAFELTSSDDVTTLTYTGEIGSDLWQLGQWWTELVAAKWEATVASSLRDVLAEVERQSGFTPS